MNGHPRSHTTYLEPIEGSEDLLLTIPDEILAAEDWRVGDVLEVEASGGRILFTNRSKRERKRSCGDANAGADTDAQKNADAQPANQSDPQRRRTLRSNQVKLAKLNQTPSVTPLKGKAALNLLKKLGIVGDDGKPTKAYR